MDTVKQEKSNVLVIAVMFLLFFMIAFVTNFAGSMGVIVKTQFGASNALSQLGTLANFIAYACFGIPVGLILKRRGYKFTSLLATIVAALATPSAERSLPSFWATSSAARCRRLR